MLVSGLTIHVKQMYLHQVTNMSELIGDIAKDTYKNYNLKAPCN